MFTYDAGKIDPKELEGRTFNPIPEGDYQLQILSTEEKMSTNGNQMVVVKCEVASKESLGRLIWHNVTFLAQGKPGQGMALKFLKTIGQPYEGKLKVDSKEWEGKIFDAHLSIEEYMGKKRNKIAWLLDGIKGPDSDVPF